MHPPRDSAHRAAALALGTAATWNGVPARSIGLTGSRSGDESLASSTLGGLPVGPAPIRKALYFSLLDGVAASVMIAITETFGIAAAVSLGAPSLAIAILGSGPLFLGALGQYLLPAFTDVRARRKRWVLRAVAMQVGCLALAALTGYLPASVAPWSYVGCFVVAGVSANSVGAAWTSWMGDLVEPSIRGRHFAWRSRVFSYVNLSCALLVGLSASKYKSHNAPWTFFTVVLSLAALCRAISWLMLQRQHEPPSRCDPSDGWRARPSPQLRRFALANGAVQGATAMSGPFFTVFYLRELQFSYLTLAIAGCAAVLGSIVSLPFWGALADRIGSGRVLRISGLLVCLVPIPYCFCTDYRMIWVFNLLGGMCWAGYNLVSLNALLQFSDEGNRTSLIAYASLIVGVLVFSMTLLGGALSTRLPTIFEWPLQSLFFLSGLLRLAAVAVLPSIPAQVKGKSSRDAFFEIPGYRVGLGLMRNVFRAFRG